MNNHEDKKDKAEENFINNLFEKKEKDQNEQLYKNEFYILEEELKSKKNQNSLQFMHDVLLNKLMLEDYVPFPPKNEEPVIINNQKEEKKKEDEQDKLIEEENEFLRSLHKINYLTFSPFGLSFFEDNNKDKSNMSEEVLKEKEEKILHMIDFKYDNFEVTNDLLLNICQGFVDINKLKEENLTKNKEMEKEKEREREREREKEKQKEKEKLEQDKLLNNDNKDKDNPEKEEEDLKKEENPLEKYELDFILEIESKQKKEFYTDFINPCLKEFKNAKDKDERKKVIDKWKPLINNKDEEYKIYMKDLEEKERKEAEEKRRLREIERKKQRKKEEEERNKYELIKAYQELTKNKKRNQNKSKNNHKSKTINKQIKLVNKYNKISPKKRNIKLGTKIYDASLKGISFYNSSLKGSSKNLSQSQPKIKPKNIFK